MNRNSNVIVGVFFVLFGVIFLFANINIINIGNVLRTFFPVIFIVFPGLLMHSAFFTRKTDAGILVPGGILMTVGCTLQLTVLFGIGQVMWPGYILSVAVGLFELYIFGKREKGLLIPVFILGSLSFIFFTFTIGDIVNFPLRNYIIPLVLIAIGIVIIFRDLLFKKKY